MNPITTVATLAFFVAFVPFGDTAVNNYRTGTRGLNLIKKYEGLQLKAYKDPVGIWTIGYGHTGRDVKPGKVITKAEAERLLKKDLRKFERQVNRRVTRKLNRNQFDALVSFTFNVGAGNFASSTLLKKLNKGDFKGAANEFLKWDKAGDPLRVLPGLARRRMEERELFNKK